MIISQSNTRDYTIYAKPTTQVIADAPTEDKELDAKKNSNYPYYYVDSRGKVVYCKKIEEGRAKENRWPETEW